MVKLSSDRLSSRHHAGFTLVELLVALGLISLLLLMFAQVFQIATGTMTTQRGVMENDQRARSWFTIMGNDLKNRTMTSVIPFLPDEGLVTVHGPLNLPSYFQFNARRGFLSISENDPNSDDDVLHFTVFADLAAEPFYGKAIGFPFPPTGSDSTTNTDFSNPNQPDADDASITPNNTALSRKAEIVYFVRNGNLYRRVLLLREPLVSAYDVQPKDGTGGAGSDIFLTYPSARNFWSDYDFSARYSDDAFPRALFLGTSASGAVDPLDNDSLTGYSAIAIPLYRFGHNPATAVGNENGSGVTASLGNPREYVFGNPPAAANQNSVFIGRFTHEETSNLGFQFPQAIPVTGNPFSQNVQLTVNSSGTVTQFADGTRRGEDILLTNVHGFDVKVWDELYAEFVDIGHALSNAAGVAGDFHQGRNRRPTYGPLATANNRMFDTWHPNFNANNDPVGGLTADADDSPPFVPKRAYPFARPGSGSPSGFQWGAGNYSVGDIVIPTSPLNEYVAYQLTAPAGGGNSTGEPDWSLAPAIGSLPFTDPDGLTWTAIPNLKRLKSLKITIRYLDVSSDQMRQVTLIQSLMD